MENIFTKKNIIGMSVIASVLFVTLGLRAGAAPSADDLLRQAYEKRIEARREHCKTIADKIVKAYSGDATARAEVPKSAAWFLNEYGQTHDVACLADDLPFGVGGR